MKKKAMNLKEMITFGIIVGTVSAIMNNLVSHLMAKYQVPQQLFGFSENKYPERIRRYINKEEICEKS